MKRVVVGNLSNLGFGLAILITVVVGVFAAGNLYALLESNNQVSHTLIVLGRLEETLTLLLDSETSGRGYVITGEERYLEPYTAALAAENGIAQHLQALRELTGDNPNQQERLEVLDTLVTEKLAFIQRNIDLRRNVGFEAARDAVRTDQGKQAMDNIRQLIAVMEAEERGLLETRSQTAATNLLATTVVLSIGAVLSLSVLAFAFFTVNHEVKIRRQGEEALQRLNDELERRVQERTGELAKANTSLQAEVAEHQRTEDALRRSEQRFRSSLENMLEGCQIIGFDWRYLYLNDAADGHNRRPKEELLGNTVLDMWPGIEETHVFAMERECMEKRVALRMETEFVFPDGTAGWFEISMQPVPEGIFILSIDITARKRAEARLQKLNRTYALLSDINQTIVHVRQPQQLFETACRIAVERGGFRMAWIGLLDAHTKQVKPVARAGESDGYLEKMEIVLDDSERGRGPTATALRAGEHVIVNEIESDPRMAPWQADALGLGYRASAAFPLMVAGTVRGTLNLYAPEPNFFDDEELKLLDEMATDIAFALEFNEEEEQRKQAEAEVLALNAQLEQRVIERTAQLEQANAELRRGQAVFQNLFEVLPGLYLVLTPELQIVAASDAYLKATMTTREGIIGRQLFDVFPDNPNDPDATGESNLRASLNYVRQTATAHVMAIQKYDIRRPDGVFEEHYWSPINSPVLGTDRRIEYIIHRVEEVTEFIQHKSQRASQPTEARLEQMEAEIFQSSRKLQTTNRLLEAANKELESFSYSVSHDLRAPLRAISGFASIVARRHRANLNEEGRHYVDNIVQASERMGQLIDDLLTYSRLGRTGIRREPIALASLIGAIVKDLQSHLVELQGTLTVEEGLPIIPGDRTLLSQIFTNLLENAMTYRRTDVPLQIAVVHRAENDQVIVAVSDNGIGILPEYQEKIFNIFQRLHNEDQYPGTGIGLATVRKSVELLGGKVWVESKLGDGSTFFVKLPKE